MTLALYNRRFILALFLLVSYSQLPVHAQDTVTEELKDLTKKELFDDILSKYAATPSDLSARSLYYVGHAYYMKEEDTKCISFMDLSIAKDPNDPAPHYIRATTLNYMGKYQDAIPGFKRAVELRSNDPAFHSGLGDAYVQLEQPELALDAYKAASEQPDCPTRPFLMIGQIYADMGKNDEALSAFYQVKARAEVGSERYLTALYNIGLHESLNGAHEKAEPIFLELVQLAPEDHHAVAKLIQVYYHQQKYEEARKYKGKLYAAHAKGELKDNLKDMFCFDQFTWNGHLVQVYERYQTESTGDIYDKHLFYVLEDNGDIALRVQTEFSPISVELGGPKYLLCANKGTTHHNPGIGFGDDLNYEELRAQAIKLFERLMK